MQSHLGSRFWRLWSAAASSNLADGISLTAIPLLAVSLTDDARLVAGVTAVRFLPFLVFGLPLGVVVDTFDRRLTAIVSAIGRSFIAILLALIVVADVARIEHLLVAAFVVGLGEVVADSGLPAMVRAVVQTDQLELANSRMASAQSVANIMIGPALGALLFAIESWIPLASIAFSLLAAAGILVLLPGSFKPPEVPEDEKEESFAQQLTLGLRFVWSHSVLRPLALTVAVFAFLSEAGNAVFVVLAKDWLGLSDFEYGLLFSADAVAALLMSLVVARVVKRIGHAGSFQLSIVLFAFANALFGSFAFLPLMYLGVVAGGASDPTWNVVSSTVRQRLVPDEVYGRMMTAYLFIAWGMQPVGAFLGGVVAEAFGPQWVYRIIAPAMLSLLVLGRPLFREVAIAMRSEPPVVL